MDGLIGELATAGGLGIIAAIALWVKRSDDKERLDEHKRFADTLESMSGQYMKTVSDNTAAITELRTAVATLTDSLDINERLSNLEKGINRD